LVCNKRSALDKADLFLLTAIKASRATIFYVLAVASGAALR